MSNTALNRVWHQSDTTGSVRTLLAALADIAREKEGVAWPAVATLAERLNASERHVKRLIKKAEGARELYVRRGNGRGNRSLYFVCTGMDVGETARVLEDRFDLSEQDARDEAVALQDETSDADDDHDRLKGDISGEKGDRPVIKKVRYVSPFSVPLLSPNDIYLTPYPPPRLSQNRNPKGNLKACEVAFAPTFSCSLSLSEIRSHLTRLSTFAHQCSRAAYQSLNRLGRLTRHARQHPGKTLRKWTVTFDRLQRLDDYEPNEIKQTMSWLLQEDNWWIEQGNFRSAAKLRKKRSGTQETFFEHYLMKAKSKPSDSDARQRAKNDPAATKQRAQQNARIALGLEK